MNRARGYLLLYVDILLYSVASICSKLASSQPFLSVRFMACYGGTIAILVLYALLWQQVLKQLPLTTAYANKSLVIALNMIWGGLLFGETMHWRMVLGALIIFGGYIWW